MVALYTPPLYPLPDPVCIYGAAQAAKEMSFESSFVTAQHHNDFAANVQQWLQYVRATTQQTLENEQRSPSAALGRVLQRTGWSYRDVGAVIGVTHTQARRILHAEQHPRDEVARRIFDLDVVTAALWTSADRDDSRLRMALQTQPSDAIESAVDVVRNQHDPALAIMYAARVLRPPQSGMATIDIAALHVPNPQRGIVADFGD